MISSAPARTGLSCLFAIAAAFESINEIAGTAPDSMTLAEIVL
jgi:hypothetical protein